MAVKKKIIHNEEPGQRLAMTDHHRLRAAEGWLGLGDNVEAALELKEIAPEHQSHPAVLEVRWRIHAQQQDWTSCMDIACVMTTTAPNDAAGWIQLAYAMRRTEGGTVQMARDTLDAVVAKFPREPVIHYNLACYYCQLGDLTGALKSLKRAFSVGDEAQMKLMALEEPDLEPLQQQISEL